MRLKAESPALEERKAVTCMGQKVRGMNELEYVKARSCMVGGWRLDVRTSRAKGRYSLETSTGRLASLRGCFGWFRTRWVLGLDPKTFECKCGLARAPVANVLLKKL